MYKKKVILESKTNKYRSILKVVHSRLVKSNSIKKQLYFNNFQFWDTLLKYLNTNFKNQLKTNQ